VPLEHKALRLRRSCPLRPNRTKAGPRALNPRHSTRSSDEKTGYSPGNRADVPAQETRQEV